jgi:hypothetical protein
VPRDRHSAPLHRQRHAWERYFTQFVACVHSASLLGGYGRLDEFTISLSVPEKRETGPRMFPVYKPEQKCDLNCIISIL